MTLAQKQQINWVLRILLAALFLVSALAKLYPSPYFALTTFEVKQLLPMGFTETTAAYFSRTLIGCEFALGFLLLQPHFYKRLVLPVSFLLLLIFVIHLSYEIAVTGNSGNCGCFGALLPMTPLQAIIKNIIAMAMLAYLFKVSTPDRKHNFSFVMSITLACILGVYLVGPMKKSTTVVQPEPVEMEQDTLSVELDTPTPPNPDAKPETQGTKETSPEVEEIKQPKPKKSGYSSFFADIDKDRKVLCFFAPGCDHCKETAKELTQLKNTVKDFPPIKIVFMDEEPELIPAFFEYAGAKYPHQIADVALFWQTLGGTKDTPGVFYLWNGNIIKEYDGINEKKFVKSAFKTIVSAPYQGK